MINGSLEQIYSEFDIRRQEIYEEKWEFDGFKGVMAAP